MAKKTVERRKKRLSTLRGEVRKEVDRHLKGIRKILVDHNISELSLSDAETLKDS
jgi:hypothetical protein